MEPFKNLPQKTLEAKLQSQNGYVSLLVNFTNFCWSGNKLSWILVDFSTIALVYLEWYWENPSYYYRKHNPPMENMISIQLCEKASLVKANSGERFGYKSTYNTQNLVFKTGNTPGGLK